MEGIVSNGALKSGWIVGGLYNDHDKLMEIIDGLILGTVELDVCEWVGINVRPVVGLLL